MDKRSPPPSSWQNSGKWYNENVGAEGHYYHRTVIIPKVLELLDLKGPLQRTALLELACGQGVLSRHIPKNMIYSGFDAAPSLIQAAKQYSKNPLHNFFVADVTRSLPLSTTDFDYATIILACQNIEEPCKAFKNASHHLKIGGKLLIVLNHPCFRIPRQSSWKVDPDQKTQYRRIDRYMSDMKVPIQMHPGKGKASVETWSFHHPLSAYSRWLRDAGFTIDLIDEWCSNKVSEGKMAKAENRSRDEIPLFMAILASKK